MITVQHRRAAPDGWEAIDPVIPDGELALTKKDSGVEVRIGDGSSAYSELLPINGRRIINIDKHVNVTLENGDEVQYGFVDSLEITPNPRCSFFSAVLTFDTAVESYINCTINYDGNIYFSGDDLEDDYFCPSENTHYTLFFRYDGQMSCHVRAIYVI